MEPSSEQTVVLEAAHLSCGYDGKPAVSGVSIRLHEGEILAILGPNGAGKSTLLKTLFGAIPPLQGSVRVNGAELSHYNRRQLAKIMGYVPQEELAQFAFTVREVVMLGRLPSATQFFDSPEDEAIVEEAMKVTGCSHLADRVAANLSGGERQRVLIARAVAQKPKVLLLDEPTSHLDVGFSLELMALLRSLATSGLGIVMAIHDLNAARQCADSGLLIAGGRVVSAGPIRDVVTPVHLDATYSAKFESVEIKGQTFVFPFSQ